LVTNAAGGGLTIQNGRTFTTTAAFGNAGNVTVGSNSTFRVNTGLIDWWKAEGNAVDSIGGNNGTLQNGTTFAPGMIGQAFSFDGINDYVSVPNLDRNVFTFATWVKRDRVSASGQQDRLIMALNNGGWGLYFEGDNRIAFKKVGTGTVSYS